MEGKSLTLGKLSFVLLAGTHAAVVRCSMTLSENKIAYIFA